MATPKAIILKEHGTNCELESKYAFEKAGGKADIIHMEDLIRNKSKLFDYQILMFPGGFSYGDDIGSGMAWANRIRNNLRDELQRFTEDDHLVLGVCNGFQVMANLGLLPALNSHQNQQVALTYNDSARYIDTWIDLKVDSYTPWLKDISRLSLPIAHVEGKFYADNKTLMRLNEKGMIALRYFEGEIFDYHNGKEPSNPNGSLENIAGITDETGRILGMMPHPERAIEFTQLPHWRSLGRKYKELDIKSPNIGPSLKIFQNGVDYFE
ncbi:MAG: phosphoribosylformylglycinamidine synthase I [Candidatus Woesearchaeota archaeon]|jgi:phosphoribosylformylglycinamidine synthase|nr:phosphoribosylformylglycinamidine synthase I [Candidatus Woesearchaeota archaeon]MDP7506145.1 phosphoribosylformylglycinamidine synthase I [Candidatus Woesearchaeota archaeon]MDP7610471.1 phosphoribosylformylglycinamidine synthase I [Candidatus Woesearchaeota archaeon]|tara:strand:+ start:311 stop:1114 length:804 start_codon:yes stop_codon:yes gene_type:complete